MKQKKIIIFMPTIEGGGVEKNFFLITNYLSTKFEDISVISLSNSYRKKLNPRVQFRHSKIILNLIGRRTKFVFSLILLSKEILQSKLISIMFSRFDLLYDFMQIIIYKGYY